MSDRKSQGKPSPVFVLIDDARNMSIQSVPLSALCDPRLRTIAEHAVHSLNDKLRSAEYWSNALEGACVRNEQWHPRSEHTKQSRIAFADCVKQAAHLREALDLAREIAAGLELERSE